MTEPNEVLEEMARAAANATMNVPVTKEEWDALPKSTKKPFFGRVKAALRAARELGYELNHKGGNKFAAAIERNARQRIVINWAKRCFTNAPVEDVQERSLRFIEEAIELVQSAGLPIEHVNRVGAHVYGRPSGEIRREVGGVGVTLLALCEVLGLSADYCELKEIERVLLFDEEHFRARHQKKIDAGLAVDAAPDILAEDA